MIIDSHSHASPLWYEPAETLLFQMDRNGVDKAVLVQVLGQFDNDYQAACVRTHPDRFISVVGIDADDADAPALLVRLAEKGARGVRVRASARSPGDAFALWRAADALGLAVSCAGPAEHFVSEDFAALVRAFPKLAFVLEHLGGLGRPETNASADLCARVFALGGFANVSLKATGLGQLAPRPTSFAADGPPLPASAGEFLRAAVAAFGPRRILWGSDFPPVAAREGYANALAWPQAALADLPRNDRDLVFGGAAAAVFLSG